MKIVRNILLIALSILPVVSFAQWDKYFENKGLRIDYSHSGRQGVDYFTIEAMKEIPFYSGSHKNLIDRTDNGAYLISLYDKNTKKLIFSKGVSSLFNEWLSMDEASRMCGNFEEVIIVPCPKEDVEIEIAFSVRDSVNNFKEVVRYGIDKNEIRPLDFFSKQAKPSVPHIITLNETGREIDKRVDLVLIPVGYTLEDREKMMQDLQKMSGYMFSEEPYKSLKGKIQITAVERYAKESGIGGLKDSKVKDSDLGVVYNTFGSPRYIMTRNLWDVYDVIDRVPCDAIIMVCNSDTYGGGGIYNYYATCYMGEKSKEVIVHEFSHSFAGLGDEYAENDSQAGVTSSKVEPYEDNVTTLVDFSKKWGDMIDKDTPIPTPQTEEYSNKVGVFEGASYISKGFYRPYLHCMMRDLTPFCPVCTKSIQNIVNLYCE
ncbi:MAG: peptidase M64 [Bacteroidales bacterium]|nr:peptidase M64 [Bacteroidales bacterium]